MLRVRKLDETRCRCVGFLTMTHSVSRYVLLAVLGLLVAPPAVVAQGAKPQRIALRRQPLSGALQEIARRFGVELLFSSDLIGARETAVTSGYLTVEQALAAVLAGTGLSARRNADGGFVIVAAAGPAETGGEALPEILVIGRRTQNVDIPRSASDVQPYRVLTRGVIRSSQPTTIEELIAKRVSAAASGLSTAQRPLSGRGSVESTFDLRGLGDAETLILIDGRRLPRQFGRQVALFQPDVNGLPPEAIERVETITSTAGGIYGPGALAGVINFVLRRDYRGGDVTATTGVTARGDAAFRRVAARVGFTPDHGATDVMLSYSRSVEDGLRTGDRDYAADARQMAYGSLTRFSYTVLPLSNSLNVSSLSGQPLQLKPVFGGKSLGSSLTSLPRGEYLSPVALGQALLSHAGAIDLSLPVGGRGTAQSLTADRRTTSILSTMRHRFGGGIELYGDYLRLTDAGHAVYENAFTSAELEANDPRNPFRQAIAVGIPLPPALEHHGSVTTVTERASLGAIVDLPRGWKINLDASIGRALRDQFSSGYGINIQGNYALTNDVPLPGQPTLDPFASTSAYDAALMSYMVADRITFKQVNHFDDFSERLAGPIVGLPEGPMSGTIVLEQRRERVDRSIYKTTEIFGLPVQQASPAFSQRVRSASAEIRVPIGSSTSRLPLLRSLELQLAVRTDDTAITVAADPDSGPAPSYGRFSSASRAATLYTVGAKVRPLDGLMLRASLATGEATPPIEAVAHVSLVGETGPDPRRGDGYIPPYDLIVFGKITPERARALSAGLVATPFGGGFSMSLDYTRIRRSREVLSNYTGLVFFFLRNEGLYPDRVTRLPLTPEDAVLGYTGGRIVRVDASYLNVGWTKIDAVDATIEAPVHLGTIGDLTTHVNLTWQPRFRRYYLPDQPAADLVSQDGGALKWRGNGGLEWSGRNVGVSLNAQYHGPYRLRPGLAVNGNAGVVARIGGELTFDLATRRTFRTVGGRSIELRFGIQDLLDRRPAVVVAAEGSYSSYSDPRRRRFQLSVTAGI